MNTLQASPPVAKRRFVRHAGDTLKMLGATAALVAASAIARRGTVSRFEARIFHVINNLPGWLFVVAWPVEQAGNYLAGVVVGLVALVTRRYRLAVAALMVTVLDIEMLVKRFVKRDRPAALLSHVTRRASDVPAHGLSFPSGHAITVTALVTILAPYLPRRLRRLAWLVVVLACIARVYVGAHDPLDVAGGAAAGVVLGGFANLLVGVPARDQERSNDAR